MQMATRAKKVLAGIAALAALAFGGAALAQAGGGSGSPDPQGPAPTASQSAAEQGESAAPDNSAADPSNPINGGALEKAKAAALDAIGGGQVTGTEVRDEEGYYEVEVTRNDGSQVDVHLDRGFNVTDQSADGGGSDGGA
jgi:peptidase YpeB-like protein